MRAQIAFLSSGSRLSARLIRLHVKSALVMTVLALLGNLVLFYAYTYQNREMASLYHVRTDVATIERDLVALESAQRGYDLTHSPVFLSPFNDNSRAYVSDAAHTLTYAPSMPPVLRALMQRLIREGDIWRRQYGTVQVRQAMAGKEVPLSDLVAGRRAIARFRATAANIYGVLAKLQVAEREQSSVLLFGIVLGWLVLMLSVGLWLVRGIVTRIRIMIQPVREVIGAVSRFARGDLAEPLVPSGDDEMQELLRSVEHMRSELALRARFDQMLLDLSTALQKSIRPRDILDQTTRGMARLFDSDVVTVSVLSSDGVYRVVTRLLYGHYTEPSDERIGGEMAEGHECVRLGTTVGYPDWTENRPHGTNDSRMFELGIRSSLHIPVFHQDVAIAVVDVGSRWPGQLREQHIDIANRVSPMVSVAMHNARTYAASQALAERDGLTGVGNRRLLDRTMERELADCERGLGPFSLIMLDIDRFKWFNDRFGHVEGDLLLQHVAQTVQETVRTQDIVARYGGEEFVVVLPGVGIEEASRLAERLRMAIAHAPLGGRRVTASLGVSTWKPGDAGEDMVRRADHALYAAKEQGRDRVRTAL